MYYDHPAVKPIRDLLVDPEITEIMINGPEQVFVEHNGQMKLHPMKFNGGKQLQFLVDRLLEPTGRSVSAAIPYADFRLPDGSRVNVVLPPVAVNGISLTIRKFTKRLKELGDLVRVGTLDERMAYLLAAAVKGRLNLLFSGATGTGKTTTLGIVSRYISEAERIVTIEDTAELQLRQQHVVSLECRRPNQEGRGEVTMSELVRNALRMRPTRIIVGEVRGPEAVDMLQAIATGHEGCLGVVHASSPADAVSRLEMMALSAGLQLPLWAIHKQIGAAIDLIVQHELLIDGSRKITHITEVRGVRRDHVVLHDVFEFRYGGQDESGRQTGQWVCRGVKSDILARCERLGVKLNGGVVAADESSS